MSVAKMIEISADSPKSFDDAIQHGIDTAGKTVEGIRGAWIKDKEMIIANGKITTYRVHLKITFELKS